MRPTGTEGDENLRRLAFSLYIPAFFLSLGMGIVNPVLPLFAKSFDVSFGLATLVVAATGIGRVVADIPSGMLMDRIGRKPLLLLGAFLAMISGLLSGLAQGFLELILYRLVTGAGMAMWVGARQTMVADSVKIVNRGKVMSSFMMFNMMGMSFGPALGGFAADLGGFRAPFFLYALTSMLALVFSYMLVHESKPQTSRKLVNPPAMHPTHPNPREFLNRSFLGLSFATFSSHLKWAARNALIPFYVTFALGLSLGEVGLMLSILSFSTMVLATPSGMIMDKFGRKKSLIPSLALSSLALFLFPLTKDFSQAVYVSILMGIATGLGAGALGTVAVDMGPREGRGVFMSVWRLMGDTGAVVGPLIAGVIIDFYGLEMAFEVLASMMLLSTITTLIFLKETFKKGLNQP